MLSLLGGQNGPDVRISGVKAADDFRVAGEDLANAPIWVTARQSIDKYSADLRSGAANIFSLRNLIICNTGMWMSGGWYCADE